MKPRPPRRSLQRWIALLVNKGSLIQSGAGRTARDHLPASGKQTGSGAGRAVAATPLDLAVLREADGFSKAVRQPLFHRTPAGCNSEFLSGYILNRTFPFLPKPGMICPASATLRRKGCPPARAPAKFSTGS